MKWIIGVVGFAIGAMAWGQQLVEHEHGTHWFPDGVRTREIEFSSANGVEGRLQANTTGVFLESPDPAQPNAASTSHWMGFRDPSAKNRVCNATAATNKGVDCGSDADCGGTIGACAVGSYCSSAAVSPGAACQLDSNCLGGTCNTGIHVTNFPATGRQVFESGGGRTFAILRRDFLMEGRPAQTPGATGVCIKQSGACTTDAGCTTKYCNGGANKDLTCTVDADCPSALCETTHCMNALCTKTYGFTSCTQDSDCTTPSGQICWRGFNSYDILQRGYDCAVDTNSTTSPTGDSRIDVASGDGEGNCNQSQVVGGGSASSTEHQFRWRMEIDNPGFPTRASGIARCVGGVNDGIKCTSQAGCTGGVCESRDPYEAYHLELSNENVPILKANKNGQVSFLHSVLIGDNQKRCSHHPLLVCSSSLDCPPWQGGDLDICAGDELNFGTGTSINSTVLLTGNASLRPVESEVLRLADFAGGDILTYTDPNDFADLKKDFRMQCEDGTCGTNASSNFLIFRAENGGTKNWRVFANGNITGTRLSFRRPGASATPSANADGVAIEEDTGAGAAVLTTPNGFIKIRKDNGSLNTCDSTREGWMVYRVVSNVGAVCVCIQSAAGPTYTWRRMDDHASTTGCT